MSLSVIHINIDSLNRHFLSPYGFEGTEAPNLAAFADRATTFETHYVGSMACMPARRELWTGRMDFLHRPWGPIEPFDKPLARYFPRPGSHRLDGPLAQDRVNALITDHYHFFEWGAHGYVDDFHGYRFIRGHELDPYRTAPLPPYDTLPGWAKPLYRQGPFFQRYVRNALHFNDEADFFAPRVMEAASDWLEHNHHREGFYLMVDCFDVHEPFHVPEPYQSMYTDLSPDEHTCWTHYGQIGRGPLADFDEDDLAFVRAQYRGKITMTDRWLGHVLDTIDRLKLWERALIIVGSDHGHYLGDHGWIGKPACPCYDALARIPLFMHHPDVVGGQRIDALTHTLDLYPTVLEALGLAPAWPCHGSSLLPLLQGAAETLHEAVIYGYFGRQMNVTDGTWTYHLPPVSNNHPLHYYSAHPMNPVAWFDPVEGDATAEAGQFIAGVEVPVWKTPCTVDYEPEPPMLFNTHDDPQQHQNRLDAHPDHAARLRTHIRHQMDAVGAPAEQYARFGL